MIIYGGYLLNDISCKDRECKIRNVSLLPALVSSFWNIFIKCHSYCHYDFQLTRNTTFYKVKDKECVHVFLFFSLSLLQIKSLKLTFNDLFKTNKSAQTLTQEEL